jgi:hypothetical protein
MKKIISLFLFAALPLTLTPEEQSVPERPDQTGDIAGFASRNATVLSMVGWGLSIGVGIAALTALIENDHAHTD